MRWRGAGVKSSIGQLGEVSVAMGKGGAKRGESALCNQFGYGMPFAECLLRLVDNLRGEEGEAKGVGERVCLGW